MPVSPILSVQTHTIYCQTQFDLKNEPVVLVVPPITDRYYTFEFLDAYTNVFAYIGTRATGSTGGTYLIAGPDWNGQVPEGMTKIWSPTNLAWFINRILVKGPSDVPNVNAIQDKISVKPVSAFQGKAIPSQSSSSTATAANASSTKQVHSIKHRLLNKMADLKQACKLLKELELAIGKLRWTIIAKKTR
jgi:hypothetical protein